jgi:HSP20 family protein
MSLAKYDPWRSLEKAELELRHFFDNFKNGFSLSTSFDNNMYMPRVDTSEDQKNFYISAELPGMKKEDVKVTLADNVLTIKGKKERSEETKEKNYHRIERSFGEFLRQMELPPGKYGKEQITADFKDGVLEVCVPKDGSQKATQAELEIPINTK